MQDKPKSPATDTEPSDKPGGAFRAGDRPSDNQARVGVLLVNLGTPDGTDFWSMRRYLQEFLTDRRVIEWSRLFWYPLLYGIILNTRPGRKGKDYATIWNNDRDESFLRTYTRSQAEKLASALSGQPQITADWAMRYGTPSISDKLGSLTSQGCERILLFPLYPQYAASTTATVNDKAFAALMKMRWQPALRTVPPYHDHPAYIDALATSIKTHLASLDFEPDILLASFHGIPQSYADKGDPYPGHCHETARLLRDHLGWSAERLQITFQSRFGPEEWLQPYTDKTVEKLARQGTRRLAIINPGFVSDCLETLEEIAVEAAEIFHQHGGENFTHIPCLNDSDAGMSVIEAVVQRELQGWE